MDVLVLIPSHCNDHRRFNQLQKLVHELTLHKIPVIVSISADDHIHIDVCTLMNDITTFVCQPVRLSQFQHLMCATFSEAFRHHDPDWILCVDDDDEVNVDRLMHELLALRGKQPRTQPNVVKGCGLDQDECMWEPEKRTDWCGTMCSRFIWGLLFDVTLCERFSAAFAHGLLDCSMSKLLREQCPGHTPKRPYMQYEPMETFKCWQCLVPFLVQPANVRDTGIVDASQLKLIAATDPSCFINPYLHEVEAALAEQQELLGQEDDDDV